VGCRAVGWSEIDAAPGVDRLVVHPYSAMTRQVGGGHHLREANSVSGACVAVRRTALEAMGGFDERFFAYYEETDLFARMKRAGWAVVTEPAALVRHQVATSLGEGSPRYVELLTRNRYLFAVRNFDRSFLLHFLVRYVGAEALNACRGWTSVVGRARARGAVRALSNTPSLLMQRRSIVVGGSYNARLIAEEPPSVSVVIANHNHADRVLGAVASARGQTLSVAEVRVVDDGSTDSSRQVLRALDGELNVQVMHMRNSGVVAARNAGAERASGDWLVFLDADDALAPRYLERTWDAVLRQRGRVGIVTTGVREVGPTGGKVRLPPRHRLARLATGNYVHCASLMRAEAFEEAGRFSADLADGYEDWGMALSIASRGWRVATVREPLLDYWRAPGAASRNAGAQARERRLREAIRALHPDLYSGGLGRRLAWEIWARTHLARLSAVLREARHRDVRALARRMNRSRSEYPSDAGS
jgi:GT2 family glycosyltransferase